MTHDHAEKVIAAVSGATMAVIAGIKKVVGITVLGQIKPPHIDYSQLLQVSLNAAVGAIVGLAIKWLWDKVKNRFNNKK